MRQAEFKIAFQTGASAHFAKVAVVLDPESSEDVILDCPPMEAKGWEAAIVRGAKAARCELAEQGFRCEGAIRIVSFVGLVSDTDDEDASAATFMAVAHAVTGSSNNPALVAAGDHDERWKVVWKTSMT